jgi:hypothetical protein
MAFTCEAVAGRGLGWFVNWATGSLLARLVGPLNDDLNALAVLKQTGIEFGLDGARG